MSSQTDFASRSPISHSHLPCFAVRTLVSLWYSWPGSCQPCWKPSEQIYLVSHLIKECASIINKAFFCTLAQFNLLILCQRASRGIFFFLAGIHKSWHQHSVLHTVWAVAEHLISTQKLCAKSSFKVLFVQVVLGLFCNFWLLWKCVSIIFSPDLPLSFSVFVNSQYQIAALIFYFGVCIHNIVSLNILSVYDRKRAQK